MSKYESFLGSYGFSNVAYAYSDDEIKTLVNIAEQAFSDYSSDVLSVEENAFQITYSLLNSTCFTIFKAHTDEYKKEYNIE